MKVLAIETSCDETSVAVVEDGRKILSNLISTQIATHQKFGGVVPEIASRMHLEQMNRILALSIEDAGIAPQDIDLVAVTRGPGLVGALLVGVSCAKATSVALGVPIVGVNHMQGHICANYLAYPELEPPFLTLVVSGGHTYLCRVDSYESYTVLGSTRDDAAGESFDKVSRALGLGYPGGPAIEKAAAQGNPEAFAFPHPMLEEENYDFSFSGLKTAVTNLINEKKMAGHALDPNDVAASFQKTVIDVLVEKSARLVEETGMRKFAISGGVAANGMLDRAMRARLEPMGVTIYKPPLKLCTDNAAMIGAAGYYQYQAHGPSALDFETDPDLGL